MLKGYFVMVTASNRFQPDYAVPPGWVLEERLEANGMSQAEFARRCGRSAKHISEIIAGKAPVEEKTALQFEKVLGVDASIWLGLEKDYRLHLAREAEARVAEASEDWVRGFPVDELVKRGTIRVVTSVSDMLTELLKFFGVASIKAWLDKYEPSTMGSEAWMHGPDAGALGSEAGGSDIDAWDFGLDPPATGFLDSPRIRKRPALATWLRFVEIEARRQSSNDYDRSAFLSALKDVRQLTGKEFAEALKVARQLCNEAGVALVWAKPFPTVSLNGAVWWLSPRKPVIALSGRKRSNDQIWFSLFKGAAHILLHSKKKVFFEGDKLSVNGDEAEADEWAASFLIPLPVWQHFVTSGEFDSMQIQRFAVEQGIAPGIVVGRLQRDGLLDRAELNELKIWAKWSDDGRRLNAGDNEVPF